MLLQGRGKEESAGGRHVQHISRPAPGARWGRHSLSPHTHHSSHDDAAGAARGRSVSSGQAQARLRAGRLPQPRCQPAAAAAEGWQTRGLPQEQRPRAESGAPRRASTRPRRGLDGGEARSALEQWSERSAKRKSQMPSFSPQLFRRASRQRASPPLPSPPPALTSHSCCCARRVSPRRGPAAAPPPAACSRSGSEQPLTRRCRWLGGRCCKSRAAASAEPDALRTKQAARPACARRPASTHLLPCSALPHQPPPS